MKENFMIVHLQHICTQCHEVILSGSTWFCSHYKNIQLCSRCFNAEKNLSRCEMHTCHSGENNLLYEVMVKNMIVDTKDKDDVFVNSFFETPDAFLNKCQKSHFQFDTLSHAKYSSMMILLSSTETWSENNVLKLVVAVESDIIHPIGKAIREAAKVAKCSNVKADDGTYMEEPGSGAVASIGKKIVFVGTLEWVRRASISCEFKSLLVIHAQTAVQYTRWQTNDMEDFF
ncbi:unnamed protein product [Lactuca saligna]|uniref:histone acetyltransferase n=1 Tax=Lactuca saligna TaxID=75948 RepID=A0AA35Z2X0_LACSI|nr:unnamed protein product [Lactuca saligna]